MISLQKGQKVDLTKTRHGLNKLLIGLGWDVSEFGNYDFDLDASAVLLRSGGKVGSNLDFVYYGNLEHATGCVRHMGDSLTGGSTGDDEQISIDLAKVPDDVDRIIIAVSIYNADTRHQNFGMVSNSYIRVSDLVTGEELLRYDLKENFSFETSIVAGEIYRHSGEWKFNCIGSGFNGGLKQLCLNYGVDLKIKDRVRGAIVLEKGHKVNLSKGTGEILINLNWHHSAGGVNGTDLDLGCLYELQDGSKGAVQALGNRFGSLNGPPYVSLDGDDRTGDSEDGENLRVNSAMIPKIKRILVYTFIYEGTADWKGTQGVVTVKCPGNRDVIVRMDEYGSDKTMCAIALLENKDGNSFSMQKEVVFYHGHKEMDEAFGWGLRWVHGTKD